MQNELQVSSLVSLRLSGLRDEQVAQLDYGKLASLQHCVTQVLSLASSQLHGQQVSQRSERRAC